MVIGLPLSSEGKTGSTNFSEEGNMRKGFLILLAAALVAAMVAPAVAGTDINGYYRAKEWVSNFHTNGTPVLAKDAPTNAYVEQRLRLRFASGEENVKAVAFFEIDFSSWGDTAGSSVAQAERNKGGALGGDKINLETKNVYVWFKVPNTPVDFTVGLQTQTDAYAGLLYGGADMAGVFMNGKFEPVTLTLGMAKLYENDTTKWDDMSLYVASAKFSPTKVVKLGLNFYFLQDDTEKIATNLPAGGAGTGGQGAVWNALPAGTNKKKIYFPGVDVAFNAGPATLSGFFVYNFGKIEYTVPGGNPDIDIKGFAADARIDLNAGPGKLFVEGLYISGGDNVAKEVKSIVTFSDFDASPGGNSAFSRTGMSILLNNADAINTSESLVGSRTVVAAGSTSPALGGRGLIHAATGFSMKVGPRLTTAVGLGYLRANKLQLSDTTKKGKTLGTEVNANVSYNIMKGLDFGVYGAYAWLGDYFESTTVGAVDPDNAWSGNLRLNYAF
jgi:hypothetical protein